MILINFVAFVIFKILLNLVSMQSLLNTNICWHKQNLENCSTWTHICFQCTFRVSYWFCLIFSFQGYKKCFTWNGFSRKRSGVTMRNYVETCKGICGYSLVYNFFVYLRFLCCTFQTHFSRGRRHFQNMVLRLK